MSGRATQTMPGWDSSNFLWSENSSSLQFFTWTHVWWLVLFFQLIFCRYQSLSLNHIREHSMPIYEFRWCGCAGMRSDIKEGSCCPVLKWDGESFNAKNGGDPFSSLARKNTAGQTLFCWTARKKAQMKNHKEDLWDVEFSHSCCGRLKFVFWFCLFFLHLLKKKKKFLSSSKQISSICFC